MDESAEPTVNSWVTYSTATNTGSSSWISANWTVPSDPVNVASQIIYFFPGFENQQQQNPILQPVLGWNQYGGGPGWTIGSWNCCVNNNNLHSPFVAVSAGNSIYGYVWGTSCTASTGVCSSWQVYTSAAGGGQTTLNTDSYGQAMNWVFGVVLEAYNIDTCQRYPPSDQISFTNITVRDVTGATAQPAWSPVVNAVTPSCGAATTISSTTAGTINWQCQYSASTACSGICGQAVSDGCGGTIQCPACGCPTGYQDCGGTCVKNGYLCP